MSAEVIFVSYSRRDKDFAEAIANELESLGAKVWIDREITLGKSWDNEIDDAIDEATHMVLIMSTPAAISENVRDEVSEARELGKDMVPILVEPIDPEHIPFRWKRMQYADFVADPERAMKKVLSHLGFEHDVLNRFLKLRSKLRVPKPSSNVSKVPSMEEEVNEREQNMLNELVSEVEINTGIEMHEKGRQKDIQLIGGVVIGIIILFLVVKFVLEVPLDKDNMVNIIIVGMACLMCLGLAIKPIGKVHKRNRNIELLKLFKIKRARLVNIIDKMTDKEIKDTNNEFDNLIAI